MFVAAPLVNYISANSIITARTQMPHSKNRRGVSIYVERTKLYKRKLGLSLSTIGLSLSRRDKKNEQLKGSRNILKAQMHLGKLRPHLASPSACTRKLY